MPTTIAIESKPVVLFGIRTPFEHLYLVKTITDASGRILEEKVIRGDLAADGTLATQADIDLAASEDARGSTTPAQRHRTLVDLDGRDPDQVWTLMVQHARNVDRANLLYGVEAFSIDEGGDVNSDTVIGSALHTVGINLAAHLPAGISPSEVPLYNRLDAMLVNDNLIGGALDDLIFGGVGRDRIDGRGGNDRIFGESGADTLVGDVGNDLLDGGVGADVMNGGLGNDVYRVDSAGDRVFEGSQSLAGGIDLVQSTVTFNLATRPELAGLERLVLRGSGNLGGKGNDLSNLLYGNAGANVLSGLAADDLLKGGSGSDNLIGGYGNDTLKGDAGNDILRSGAGRDTLWGGTGSDRFVFNRTYESTPNLAARDRVLDFSTADVIDLHGIDANVSVTGDQGFSFIGSAAFTMAGQLGFALDGSGNTIVQANVDSDLAADFELFIGGYTRPLAAGDFML